MFVHKKNVLTNLDKDLKIQKQSQYNETFDNLQEGIIVLDKEDEQINVLFTNECCWKILHQFFKQTESQINISNFESIQLNVSSKIFTSFRGDLNNQLSQD